MAKSAPKRDVDDSRLEVGPPAHTAAGVPGVIHALEAAYEQMGVRRAWQTLALVNQPKGFDCPGCAWPDPDKPQTIDFCENGAKAVAEEATLRRIDADFFAAHSVADLAERSDYWLGQQGRLTEPMVLHPGETHYRPISWEDAYQVIVTHLRGLNSPDEAIFYTSGRTSNEAAYLYQLMVRAFGTNNLPDCSNMCHESSGSALNQTIGIGKGTVTLDDIENTDLLIIAGQNPGTNHPRMLSSLEKAKANGARIIAVNPLMEAGLTAFANPQTPRGVVGAATSLADHYAQIRVNGDLAFFLGLNKLLIDAHEAGEPSLDLEFIRQYTDGYPEYRIALNSITWAEIERASGLSLAEMVDVATQVRAAKSIIVCWAMGLTQHKNSVPTIREVMNFLLLRGNIGRPGAGPCPVRGHSNVQGDRTVGINERPPAALLDALEARYSISMPRHHGFDVVEAIRAMRDGRGRVLIGMGGNFVRATPDTDVTVAAVRKCDLTVHISTKLNGSHAVTGKTALILPTLGRTDADLTGGGAQRVSVEDSMGMVHASRGRLDPPARTVRSEVAIVTELAGLLLPEVGIDWAGLRADYDRIRDEIAVTIPGFEQYNQRLNQPRGFALPNGPRDSRSFATDTGLAHFSVNELEVIDVPKGRLLLQTVRSHDQYNTTIYGLDDRYRGIKNGRRVLFIHSADRAELGFDDGQLVDLVSYWPTPDGVEQRRAEQFRLVDYPTARGCVAAYFPETNVLVPLDSTADESGTPTSKSIIIGLEASRNSPLGGSSGPDLHRQFRSE